MMIIVVIFGYEDASELFAIIRKLLVFQFYVFCFMKSV